jgi:regulator of sigma E protease
MLSVYLGLFNLLPLPALDGGRAVFIGLESITRRKFDPRIEQAVHTAGFVLLMGVLLVVSWKDIRNLIARV